jgi:hypothetical protein
MKTILTAKNAENTKSEVRIKKSALTPALSPWEREKRFLRSGKIQALDLQWFRGSMRGYFREILTPGFLVSALFVFFVVK